MSVFSKVTPGPFETRPIAPSNRLIVPKISLAQPLQTAHERARSIIGNAQPVAFSTPGHWASTALCFFTRAPMATISATICRGGVVLRAFFTQLQLPQYSGRILGFAGRVMMSLMGLVVAMLSITGIVIWARKRRSRRRAEEVSSDLALRLQAQ